MRRGGFTRTSRVDRLGRRASRLGSSSVDRLRRRSSVFGGKHGCTFRSSGSGTSTGASAGRSGRHGSSAFGSRAFTGCALASSALVSGGLRSGMRDRRNNAADVSDNILATISRSADMRE